MTQPGTDIAPAGMYDDTTGLGDLGDSLAVPRLKLVHDAGVFRDPFTNEEFPELYCIVLGLATSRVLFDVNVGEDERPMCKSPDTVTGYPNMNPPNAKKAFPWAAAKLDASQAAYDEEGRLQVGCSTCFLKEWGSHPGGGADKPWCSEQFVLPVLFAKTLEQVLAGEYSPGLLTFQKSGLKPVKSYLGGFKAKNVGAFTAITRIGLVTKKTGTVVYSTPTLQRVGDTPNDEGQWADYLEQFYGIRDFLKSQKPPAPEDAGNTTTNAQTVLPGTVVLPHSGAINVPAQAPPPARPPMTAQAPVTTTVTAPVHDTSDLPF